MSVETPKKTALARERLQVVFGDDLSGGHPVKLAVSCFTHKLGPRVFMKIHCAAKAVIQSGHMTVISATEFKSKCLQWLDEVQRSGQELVVSKHGRPVARVIAVKPPRPWFSLRGRGEFKGNPFAPVLKETDIDAFR